MGVTWVSHGCLMGVVSEVTSDKMSLPLSLLLSVIPATGVLAKPLAVWWGGKAGIHGASSRTQRKPARNSVLTTEDTL